MPSTGFLLGTLCIFSVTADYALQQLYPDDACTGLPSARTIAYDGCIPQRGGAFSIAITCTPTGFDMLAYLSGTCTGPLAQPPTPVAASPCANSGSTITCVSTPALYPLPTSAAMVRATYGPDVTSCPIPGGAVPILHLIYDTGRCLNFAPALLRQQNPPPVSSFGACNPGGTEWTFTTFNARDCQQPNAPEQNATGCEVENGSPPQVSFTTCYGGSAGASASTAITGIATATPSQTPNTLSNTASNSPSNSPTLADSLTMTSTSTLSRGATASSSPSISVSSSGTDSLSLSASKSHTPTPAVTAGASQSVTPTATPTSTATASPTASLSNGASPSVSASRSYTSSASFGAAGLTVGAQVAPLTPGAVAAIVIFVVLIFVVAPIACCFCGAAATCAALRGGGRAGKLLAPGGHTTIVQMSPMVAAYSEAGDPLPPQPPPQFTAEEGGAPQFLMNPLVAPLPSSPPHRTAPMHVGRTQQIPPGWVVQTDGEDTWYVDAAGQSQWMLPQRECVV